MEMGYELIVEDKTNNKHTWIELNTSLFNFFFNQVTKQWNMVQAEF